MKLTNVLGAFAVAAIGITSTVQADELKFAHVYEVGHPLHVAAEKAQSFLLNVQMAVIQSACFQHHRWGKRPI